MSRAILDALEAGRVEEAWRDYATKPSRVVSYGAV